MSTETDTMSSAAAETSAAPAVSSTSSEPIGLSPKVEAPNAAVSAPASEAPRLIDIPKMIEMPKPVEAAMKAASDLKLSDAEATPVAPLEEPAIVPLVRPVVERSRANRFALLAASVAFAGALGAMAGALGTSVVSRGTAAETPVAAVDLAPVRDSIASLRAEIAAIKGSVEASNRNTSAQFAKLTERLERIDRTQAHGRTTLPQTTGSLPSTGPVQAAGSPQTTGLAQPQQAAATLPPAPGTEAARQRVLDGWTIRNVNRGVAVIQGRRMGAFGVETGDIVPGLGRIESIRRQDGRWIVLTSNGMITSSTAR